MNKSVRHIALVANTSWSIYNFRAGVIREMMARGYKVYAIAPRDDYSDKLTAIGATYIPLNLATHSLNIYQDVKVLLQLIRIYRKYQFDFIFHYTIKANIYGSIAARMNGLRSVSVVTGLGRSFQFRQPIQFLVNRLYRIAAYCTEALWFLNESDRSAFISKKIIIQRKTSVLPSEGINTSKFKGSRIDEKEHQVIRLLFAGRLLKDKGILEFVAAAQHFAKAKYVIKFEVAGFVNPKNPMSVTLDQLEEWQRLGWINYLGSHEDIRPFINRSDCVVFPSYYAEGISRILLEAASMSRPIITTDQVGCREVVQHNQNGWLVEPRSVESLIMAIEQFNNTPIYKRILMGARGRKIAKRFFDERLVIHIYIQHLNTIWKERSTNHTKKNAGERSLM